MSQRISCAPERAWHRSKWCSAEYHLHRHVYFEDAEAEAAKEVGVRGVLGQTIIGFPAPDYRTWREALAGAERFLKRYAKDELITPAVAPARHLYDTRRRARGRT